MHIELSNISKSYDGEKYILKDFNFNADVHSMAIIGGSGSGKSTLIRLIGGLIPLTSGDIRIAKEHVPHQEKELLQHRRKIGFVFQHSGLFYHMNALKNITLPLIHAHGASPAEAEKRALELFERFGLSGHEKKYPRELSGGQQQRVAIARAMAARPALLLLDEPTSALDPILTNEVLKVLQTLKEDSQAFIVVTHHMGFAQQCDDLMFMQNGECVEFGKSTEVFANPKNAELKDFIAHASGIR